MLTNYNPEKGKFEKKIQDNHYATMAEIVDGVVIGNMFELPLSDEAKYIKENDYVSQLNIQVFSKLADKDKGAELIKKADNTQKVLINNLNWLKSYYYLSMNDFTNANNYLNALIKSVGDSPDGEQRQWKMFIMVLRSEIEIQQKINEE